MIQCKRWKEFDENFTKKVLLNVGDGTKMYPISRSVGEYFTNASCLPYVKDIKVPTLVIHSRDDPIVPIECVPVGDCLSNRNILLGITNKGAHCLYF